MWAVAKCCSARPSSKPDLYMWNWLSSMPFQRFCWWTTLLHQGSTSIWSPRKPALNIYSRVSDLKTRCMGAMFGFVTRVATTRNRPSEQREMILVHTVIKADGYMLIWSSSIWPIPGETRSHSWGMWLSLLGLLRIPQDCMGWRGLLRSDCPIPVHSLTLAQA